MKHILHISYILLCKRFIQTIVSSRFALISGVILSLENGSPGIRRTRTNTTLVSTKSVTMANATRLAIIFCHSFVSLHFSLFDGFDYFTYFLLADTYQIYPSK